MNVYLELSGLVDGGIEQGEQALGQSAKAARLGRRRKVAHLMGDVGTGFANIAAHLSHDANVLVGIQQRVFLVAGPSPTPGVGLVGFERGIGQDDDQTLRVTVRRGDGLMLLSNKLW